MRFTAVGTPVKLDRFGTLSTRYLTPRFAKKEQILRKIGAGAVDSASKLSAFTFITPLFGVVASYVILHDTLTPVFGAAAILVIAGLYLVNRPSPAIPAAIDPLLNVTKT